MFLMTNTTIFRTNFLPRLAWRKKFIRSQADLCGPRRSDRGDLVWGAHAPPRAVVGALADHISSGGSPHFGLRTSLASTTRQYADEGPIPCRVLPPNSSPIAAYSIFLPRKIRQTRPVAAIYGRPRACCLSGRTRASHLNLVVKEPILTPLRVKIPNQLGPSSCVPTPTLSNIAQPFCLSNHWPFRLSPSCKTAKLVKRPVMAFASLVCR